MKELDLEEISEEDAQKIAEEMGESLSSVMTSLFGGFFNGLAGAQGDELQFNLQGDFSAVERIELYSNGKQMDRRGYSFFGNERNQSFEKPASSKVVIKVLYWNNPTTVNMAFDL